MIAGIAIGMYSVIFIMNKIKNYFKDKNIQIKMINKVFK
jgi:hypothetical protein